MSQNLHHQPQPSSHLLHCCKLSIFCQDSCSSKGSGPQPPRPPGSGGTYPPGGQNPVPLWGRISGLAPHGRHAPRRGVPQGPPGRAVEDVRKLRAWGHQQKTNHAPTMRPMEDPPRRQVPRPGPPPCGDSADWDGNCLAPTCRLEAAPTYEDGKTRCPLRGRIPGLAPHGRNVPRRGAHQGPPRRWSARWRTEAQRRTSANCGHGHGGNRHQQEATTQIDGVRVRCSVCRS